jgi:DNA helicase-2/ATP-dependent DNA helicase PcrA
VAPRVTAPREASPRTALAPGALGSATSEDDWLEGAEFGERPSLRAGLAAASPDFEAQPRGPRDADERDSADTPLLGFLEQLALVGDADAEGDGERASLMTLHAAKGLEFDAVWMTGMEERVFPGSRALGLSGPNATGEADPDELAEERRLCYVGMTRARKRLTLTLARCRSLFGELKFNEASRFLRELPPALATGLRAIEGLNEGMSGGGGFGRGFGGGYGGGRGRFDQGGRGGQTWDEFDQRSSSDDAPASPFGRRPPAPTPKVRPQATAKPPGLPAAPGSAGAGTATVEGFAKGMRVRHAAFGIGSVEELDGGGQGLKLLVRFPPGVGLKKVLARFVERV